MDKQDDTNFETDLNDVLIGTLLMVVFRRQGFMSFKRMNKNAARELAASKNVDENTFIIHDDLLAGANVLVKAIHREVSRARTFWAANTLPWHTSGARVIPNVQVMDLLTGITPLIKRVDVARQAFVAAYPALRDDALRRAAGVLDPSYYPTVDEIDQRFRVQLDLMPMPTMQTFEMSRAVLPARVAELVATKMVSRQRKVAETAVEDIRARIVDQLSRMAKVLAKKAAGEPTKVTDTLLEHLRPLAKLARNGNITGDAAVASVVGELDALANLDIKVLRTNPAEAAKVAERASAILGVMGAPTPTPEPIQEPEDSPAPITPPDPAPPEPFDTTATEAVADTPVQDKAPDSDLPWWAQEDDVEYPEAETY